MKKRAISLTCADQVCDWMCDWDSDGWRGGCSHGGTASAASRAAARTAVERITLAPRQSLALVEAEGRRILVATSPKAAPAFYALDEMRKPRRTCRHESRAARAPEGFMVGVLVAQMRGGSGDRASCYPI